VCEGPLCSTGKVVVWLHVFSIFLAVTLGLFATLALYANRTFERETYEHEKRKNLVHDTKKQTKPRQRNKRLRIHLSELLTGCLVTNTQECRTSY